VTGHADNQNAAKLTITQKQMVAEALEKPPSESGVSAKFWDVPALKNLISMRFDVEYAAESSLHLLMRFCGMSFKYPDAVDQHRDEGAIATRMTEVRQRVSDLLEQGHAVFAADEVRIEHEAEIRRTWLPRGQRTKIDIDRKRAAQSYFGALNIHTGVLDLERIEGQQDTDNIIQVLARFQRKHPDTKLALVWDNAAWHKSKQLRKLFREGEVFEDIARVYLPPYAPDHNPIEHVWNHAKGAIANLQRETPEETFSAFEKYISGRTFEYNFDNLKL
jgi:transposase